MEAASLSSQLYQNSPTKLSVVHIAVGMIDFMIDDKR